MAKQTEVRFGNRAPVVRRIFITALSALFALSLASCRLADPTPDDLDRVKEEFLILRFHAPFSRELNQLNDEELFEKSCVSKRVRCERVKEMLKERDPAFYRRLKGAEDV